MHDKPGLSEILAACQQTDVAVLDIAIQVAHTLRRQRTEGAQITALEPVINRGVRNLQSPACHDRKKEIAIVVPVTTTYQTEMPPGKVQKQLYSSDNGAARASLFT